MGIIGAVVALALLVSGWCQTTAVETAWPCDPGFGRPRETPGCSDPVTGWVTRTADGRLVLTPYGTRDPRPLTLDHETICTGAIAIGYEEPLHDHLVDCAEIRPALRLHHRIRMAVWSEAGRVVQASELYHP